MDRLAVVPNPEVTFRRFMLSDDQLLLVRKTIIVAIASDDVLMERLVLKGGNALDIVYRLGERASLDVDFSMSDDFASKEEGSLTEKREATGVLATELAD
jgi:predicted nucleotidyltransferase component of viral defense system